MRALYTSRTIGRRLKCAVGFYASSINRPHVSYDWYDEELLHLGVEWGNGNSDPVWHLDLEITLPSWLARRLP